jgi:hypothetical protein
MCQPKPCSCGKTTWSGCGQHIDDVKRVVPADQWCDGHPATDQTDKPARRFLRFGK